MEYAYPPTYNTQGWEESLSLMSQGQFASTDVNAGNLSAGYPLLAAEYPAQQTMAQHLYEPMVCSLLLQSISRALTDPCVMQPMFELYRPPEPAWASPLPQLGHTATGPSYIARNDFYRPPELAWASSLPQLGHAVAGPSHVCGGATYVPQQMLPAGGSYRQAVPIAYEPADGESFRFKPLFLTDGPTSPRRTGAPILCPISRRTTSMQRRTADRATYCQLKRTAAPHREGGNTPCAIVTGEYG